MQNDNDYPEPEHIIRARYAQDSEHFIVFADILAPSFQAGWHQLSKDGWAIVYSPYGGTKYYKVFNISSTPNDWIESIDSLNKLLLAYFVNDFIPRKIYRFSLVGNFNEVFYFNLINVFGSPRIEPTRIDERTKIELFEAEKSIQSFHMTGTIFNGMREDPNAQIADKLIDRWYLIFDNKVLFSSIGLLQESFIFINRQFSSMNYFNYTEFSTGIILLVSALENLFTHNQDNFADIKFKFCVIGSLYYHKNVTTEFIQKIENGATNKKYSRIEFHQILSELYDLRSDIAHGSYKKILSNKSWKRLFKILNVHYEESINKAILLKHAALALGLLQKHLFALIIQSNTDLLRGSKIVDEMEIGNAL